MACNCSDNSGCNPCPTCAEANADCECLPSALDNFIKEFFGTVTKSVVDGQVVWTLPCNLSVGLQDNPRLPGEGLSCYFLRLFGEGIVGLTGATGPQGPAGTNGSSAFSFVSVAFTQPDISSPNITVVVGNGALFEANDRLYISGSGYYTVVARTGNTLFLTLSAAIVPAGTSVPNGNLVVFTGPPGSTGSAGAVGPAGPAGAAGAAGPTGPVGPSAQTVCLTTFNQPALGADTVALAFADSTSIQVGQSVFVTGGGYYRVVSKVGVNGVVVLKNVYDEPANVAPATVVSPTGTAIVLVCGYGGRGGYTYTTANFAQPAIGATVSPAVAESTPFVVGSFVYVPVGGYYQVTGIPTVSSITIKNLGTAGNAAPATVIAAGSKMVVGTSSTSGLPPTDTVAVNTLLDVTIHKYVFVNAAGGAKAITLPTAVGNEGVLFSVKKIDATGNNVTITPNGAETIDGAAGVTINTQYTTVEFISDGANWFIV